MNIAKTERKWTRRVRSLRREPYRMVMRAVGDEYGGNTTLPGDNATIHLREYPEENDYLCARVSEDAYSLWIGTAHRWHTHMSRDEAFVLGRFIIWRWWIRAEWCGLRRAVYIWALHRHVARFQRYRREESRP